MLMVDALLAFPICSSTYKGQHTEMTATDLRLTLHSAINHFLCVIAHIFIKGTLLFVTAYDFFSFIPTYLKMLYCKITRFSHSIHAIFLFESFLLHPLAFHI